MTSIPTHLLRWGGGLLAGALIASGSLSAADAMSQHPLEEVDTSVSASGIERVHVQADGNVTLKVDPQASAIAVRADGHTGFTDTDLQTWPEGQDLFIDHECRRAFTSNCSADLTVTLPPSIEIAARTSTGNIELHGTQTGSGARAVLRALTGDVWVSDVNGDVRATTASGTVQVNKVKGNVWASANIGDVTAGDITGNARVWSSTGRLLVQGVGGDVMATSHTGDVLVIAGDEPVRLAIHSDTGRQSVSGATDPTASRTVTISSGTGDVTYSATTSD